MDSVRSTKSSSGPARLPPAKPAISRLIPGRATLLAFLVIAANLAPAALLFYFVHHFAVDVPFWDEWGAMIPTLQQLDQGKLGWAQLIAQNNDHRLLFPRLLTLANAGLFHWNRTVEMFVTAGLLVFSAWFLFRFTRDYWGRPTAAVSFIPVAWVMFTWLQWENLIWGMQTGFALLEAGAVVAFCLLHRARTAKGCVTGAAAAAFVAGFSSAGGLLIWPVGLAQLLLQRVYGTTERKPRAGVFVVWIGAAALTGTLFFRGYVTPPVSWPTGTT
jgi:hypothetical protein